MWGTGGFDNEMRKDTAKVRVTWHRISFSLEDFELFQAFIRS